MDKIKLLILCFSLLMSMMPVFNIEAQENRNSVITRPEERGEDFTLKSNAELINYLQTSGDIVELRKTAFELGNRHIKGTYEPTGTDEQVIKNVVDSYFDMAKSPNANTREEGRFQIHRLWRLAVPALLDYLKDDDLTKMELAAKSLILMRNEDIISSVINIAERTTDTRKKKLLLFVLTKMEEQRTTIVPNRQCLGSETSKELYNRLVVPALKRMELPDK